MGLKLRHVMYCVFVVVSSIPAVLVLYTYSWAAASTGLVLSGATQLAFGFYAFTSGNATYSLCPQLGDKRFRKIREDGIEKAKNTIRAARIITIGALVLIIAGIIEPYVPKPVLLAFAVIAPIVIGIGAYRLSKNVSYPVNTFIVSRNPKDYPDKD